MPLQPGQTRVRYPSTTRAASPVRGTIPPQTSPTQLTRGRRPLPNPKNRSLTFVTLLTAIAAFGAFTSPAFSQETPAEKAVLYVVRVDPTPLLDTARVYANEDVLRPYLFGKQYARHELRPGSYIFIAMGTMVGLHRKNGWIHGNLEAGKTYGLVIGLSANPIGGGGGTIFPLDDSFKKYDRAMELVSGKPPKELDEKKQEKAEKEYQKMRASDEKRRSKGKPTRYESMVDFIEKREAKNPDFRRTLKPMTAIPLPPGQ